MVIVLYTMAGLVLWVIGWALGVKSFDVFLIAMTIVLVGVCIHTFAPAVLARTTDRDQD